MNKISDDRLREIIADDYAPDGPFYQIRTMASELLDAREKIRADEEHLPTIESLTRNLYETEQELLSARKEIELLLDNLRDRDLINEKIRADAETRIVDLNSLPKSEAKHYFPGE